MSRSTLSAPAVRRPRRATEWGLLADATHDGVTVELDEGLNGRGWRLSLTMAGLSVPLELDGPEAITSAVRLLRVPHPAGTSPVDLGTWGKQPAELVRDDEFDDRAFLILGRSRGVVPIRLTFVGPTFNGLLLALADVAGQLPAAIGQGQP